MLTNDSRTAFCTERSVNDYPLSRDDAEYARLAQQAAFWSADAAALFDSAEVAAGDRVADLGCGTPHVAQLLAQRVGPEGRVRALDNDARLVDAMRRRMGECASLQLECGDAFATSWPDGSFDAVHARFLAAPTGRLDELVDEMLRLLRPGGVLMLQEPVADSWFVPMAGTSWPRLLGLIRAGFAHRGGDFDAGRALADRVRRAGAVGVHTRSVVHELPAAHPYAALPLAFSRSLSDVWRKAGLASAAQIDSLATQTEEALSDAAASVTTFTLVQTWARRAR